MNHSLLMDKLHQYGLSNSTVQWFTSYLADRRAESDIWGSTVKANECFTWRARRKRSGPTFIQHVYQQPTTVSAA